MPIFTPRKLTWKLKITSLKKKHLPNPYVLDSMLVFTGCTFCKKTDDMMIWFCRCFPIFGLPSTVWTSSFHSGPGKSRNPSIDPNVAVHNAFQRDRCCWWFRNPAVAPVEVGSLSHYLQGFLHSRWLFGISAINSITFQKWCFEERLLSFLWTSRLVASKFLCRKEIARIGWIGGTKWIWITKRHLHFLKLT